MALMKYNYKTKRRKNIWSIPIMSLFTSEDNSNIDYWQKLTSAFTDFFLSSICPDMLHSHAFYKHSRIFVLVVVVLGSQLTPRRCWSPQYRRMGRFCTDRWSRGYRSRSRVPFAGEEGWYMRWWYTQRPNLNDSHHPDNPNMRWCCRWWSAL